jgi:hypothetical protein
MYFLYPNSFSSFQNVLEPPMLPLCPSPTHRALRSVLCSAQTALRTVMDCSPATVSYNLTPRVFDVESYSADGRMRRRSQIFMSIRRDSGDRYLILSKHTPEKSQKCCGRGEKTVQKNTQPVKDLTNTWLWASEKTKNKMWGCHPEGLVTHPSNKRVEETSRRRTGIESSVGGQSPKGSEAPYME